jgi:HAE1 family hydrophobic/amphiphilic exporter-1
MGMTVFSGMLVATVVGVLVVPAMFVMVHGLANRGKARPIEEAA